MSNEISDEIMSVEDKKKLLLDMGFMKTGDPNKFIKCEEPAPGKDLVIGFSFTEKVPEGIFWAQMNGKMMERDEVDSLDTVNLFYAEKDRRLKGKGKIPSKHEGEKKVKSKKDEVDVKVDKEKIKAIAADLGFVPTKNNEDIMYQPVDDEVTAYVDFRDSDKGVRYAYRDVEGNDERKTVDANKVDVLKKFKQLRDDAITKTKQQTIDVTPAKAETKKTGQSIDEQMRRLFESAGVNQKEYLMREYEVESADELTPEERNVLTLRLRDLARTRKKKQETANQVPQKRVERGGVPVRKKQTIRKVPMMIKNLTPRLVEVGKIKIGGKGERRTKSGTLLPEKWDHFEIATLMKDEEGRLIMDDEMNKIIGENCRELDIYLPFDDPRVNCPTWYGEYSASGVVCMGDGETAIRNGEEIECNPETCESYLNKKCKMHGRLSVMLADAKTVSGMYVFRTTSFYSISNILSSMVSIARETGGILAGIPLKLKMVPQTVTPQGVNGPVRIWTVYIDYDGTLSELKNDALVERQKREAIGVNMEEIERQSEKMITAEIEEESAIDIVEEFMPDNIEEEWE